MLSTTALDRVIELPSTSEKQNKIEAIELEALQAIQLLVVGRIARACPVAPAGNRGPDPVGPGRYPERGPGSFEKITNRPLTVPRRSHRALAPAISIDHPDLHRSYGQCEAATSGGRASPGARCAPYPTGMAMLSKLPTWCDRHKVTPTLRKSPQFPRAQFGPVLYWVGWLFASPDRIVIRPSQAGFLSVIRESRFRVNRRAFSGTRQRSPSGRASGPTSGESRHGRPKIRRGVIACQSP